MNPLIAVTLVQEKETKNMVKYVAPGDEEQQQRSNIPNIYVRKTALASAFGKFPAQIQVMIESK